jgi:hypothetical protein
MPRIWDPAKEEREERLKRIQEEMGITVNTSDGKPYVPHIKGSFRREYEQRKSEKKFDYNKIKSYIIIGTILLLCVIFFFFTRLYPYLFQDDVHENNSNIEKIEFDE